MGNGKISLSELLQDEVAGTGIKLPSSNLPKKKFPKGKKKIKASKVKNK